MIFIYDENLQIIARPLSPTYEDFVLEPNKFYPYFDANKHIYNSEQFLYAILDNGILRNKTREERILLDNETNLLIQGEYVESNQIKFKSCQNGLYKALWVTPNWIEGATLEETQLIKREELKKERDLSTVQPFEYNGVMYQADLVSQDKFFKSMMLNETDINWIALDNTIHLLTHEDFTLIVEGLKEREKQSFIKFNTLYGQVLLCETIDEIKVIVW